MPENIIDMLKSKEDEMEALLAEARKKAASIREEALRLATAKKGDGAGDIEAEVSKIRAEAAASVNSAAGRLKAEAITEAESLGEEAGKRLEEAVTLAMRLISEGTDDREDDKGPGNRP